MLRLAVIPLVLSASVASAVEPLDSEAPVDESAYTGGIAVDLGLGAGANPSGLFDFATSLTLRGHFDHLELGVGLSAGLLVLSTHVGVSARVGYTDAFGPNSRWSLALEAGADEYALYDGDRKKAFPHIGVRADFDYLVGPPDGHPRLLVGVSPWAKVLLAGDEASFDEGLLTGVTFRIGVATY